MYPRSRPQRPVVAARKISLWRWRRWHNGWKLSGNTPHQCFCWHEWQDHWMVSASSAVPLSLDKSYNWPLLNRLILRFWPPGLRHGSDWLVSLLWHQYILITFVNTLTNSLHGTRPTELAVLPPIKSDRSHFFAHIRNLIQNVKVHFFGDQYFSITLGDSHWRGGDGQGGLHGPLPPGFNPPIPAQFCSPYPRPFFFLICFRVPLPHILDFLPKPQAPISSNHLSPFY